ADAAGDDDKLVRLGRHHPDHAAREDGAELRLAALLAREQAHRAVARWRRGGLGPQVERRPDHQVLGRVGQPAGDLDAGGRRRGADPAAARAGYRLAVAVENARLGHHGPHGGQAAVGAEVDGRGAAVEDLGVDHRAGRLGRLRARDELHADLPVGLVVVGPADEAAEPPAVVARDPYADPAVDLGVAVHAAQVVGRQVEPDVLAVADGPAVDQRRAGAVSRQPEAGGAVAGGDAVEQHRVVGAVEVDAVSIVVAARDPGNVCFHLMRRDRESSGQSPLTVYSIVTKIDDDHTGQ